MTFEEYLEPHLDRALKNAAESRRIAASSWGAGYDTGCADALQFVFAGLPASIAHAPWPEESPIDPAPTSQDITQMSLPPVPWSYETNAPVGMHEGKGFVYLLDANGRKIGTVWGNPDEKIATVQFIMDAADTRYSRENAGD